MHPRVSVSGLCFPGLSATDAIEAIAGLGAANASITGAKARASGAGPVVAAARRHGVRIVTTTGALGLDLSSAEASDASRRRAEQDIDLAAAVGATVMYGLTGPRTSARWDASADAYVNAVAQLASYAAERGVRLAIEPTSWLYSDLTFVHTFHDALLVAPRAGMGICLDAFHVWTEAGLREEIAAHAGLIAHVQLSDMTPGSRALPCRAVPGDGDVPLATVVQWLFEAGYPGVFDCELNGPAIDAIGHHAAAARAASWLDKLLAELGGPGKPDPRGTNQDYLVIRLRASLTVPLAPERLEISCPTAHRDRPRATGWGRPTCGSSGTLRSRSSPWTARRPGTRSRRRCTSASATRSAGWTRTRSLRAC